MMPNEAPIQENKTEIHEAPQVSSEQKTDNTYSAYFSNPETIKKVQDQANTYKSQDPNIEKDLQNYLQKDPEKAKKINTQLNNPALDETKKSKIINAIIDASIKEAQVFSGTIQEKQTTIKQEINTDPVQIDIKKTQQEKQITTQEKQETSQENEITKIEKLKDNNNLEQINKHIEELEIKREALIDQNPKLDIKPNSPQYLEASQKLEASGTLKTLKAK
jgi:hypothetical protein